MVVEETKELKCLVLSMPLSSSEVIAREIGATDVRIKAELLQKTGSFEIRGASYCCLKMGFSERIHINRMDLIRK